jgi:hypothetical protein
MIPLGDATRKTRRSPIATLLIILALAAGVLLLLER